jgi:beta-glucosidase
MLNKTLQEIVAFPVEFVWGAATSAYQIEGACAEEGRTPSVWDTFCLRKGAIQNNDSADVACDHYHRFREDVQLMRKLTLPAYRFSVAWPRIILDDSGRVNEAGLDFYDALVDELLAADVQPWITLFHWDLPQYVEDQGGWLNPRCVQWFAAYTQVVVQRLSDRVRHWITLNEPQCFLHFGHGLCTHAPGNELSLSEQLAAAHHVLLAHGRATSIIRETAKSTPRIGWATVGHTMSPASTDDLDIEAARVATMSVNKSNLWNNTWYSDPVFLGHYPEEGLKAYGAAAPQWDSRDMEIISTPLDFLGLNIYTATPVRATGNCEWQEAAIPLGAARTTLDWTVREECLYWGPRFHAERYSVPIVITENGMSNTDWVNLDGRVRDPQRIDYLHRHLLALHRCILDGIDIQGYFQWSLMDNFEWAEGFRRRFGLIHVDFESGKRTLKDSAYWYQQVIQTNGQSLS